MLMKKHRMSAALEVRKFNVASFYLVTCHSGSLSAMVIVFGTCRELIDSGQFSNDKLRTRKQSVNRNSTRSRGSAMIALGEVPDTPVKSTLHEDGCPKSSATRPSEVISERVRINTNCVNVSGKVLARKFTRKSSC